MHRTRARLSTLVVAFVVMVALGLLGVVARADENEAYSFKLTVQPAKDTPTQVLADMKDAEVVVDVYKLADAVEDESYVTYSYDKWAAGFEEVATELKKIQDASAVPVGQRPTTDWAALYGMAAEVVATKGIEPTIKAQPFGEIELTSKGLYLVIAHGYVPADEKPYDAEHGYAGVAYGSLLKYTFPATMVSAPTKWADAEGDMSSSIYTDASYGNWENSATIYLKSSQEPLFGSLKIDKKVNDYKGEETTFVFHIVDSETGGEVYENYAAITLDGNSQGDNTVTHIPAGLRVDVEEIYFGGRYKYVGTEWLTDNVIVSDVAVAKGAKETDVLAEVLITNEPDGNHPGGGHGMENRYTFKSDGTDVEPGGDYGDPTPTPAKPYQSDSADTQN